MANPHFSLIVHGLGKRIGTEFVLQVFSTQALSSAVDAALQSDYDVDIIENYICINDFPKIGGSTLQQLGGISSSSGFTLKLASDNSVRALLDGRSAYVSSYGRESNVIEAIGDSSITWQLGEGETTNIAVGDILVLEREAVRVTTVTTSANTIGVIRGMFGSKATSHVPPIEGLVLWRGLPHVVGTKCSLYHHESLAVVATGVISSISSDSSPYLSVSVDSDYAEFSRPFTTKIPFIEENKARIEAEGSGSELIVLKFAGGAFYHNVCPTLISGERQGVLLVSGETVLKWCMSVYESSTPNVFILHAPTDGGIGGSTFQVLAWDSSRYWHDEELKNLIGEYEVHFLAEISAAEGTGIRNLFQTILTRNRSISLPKLPFGAEIDQLDLSKFPETNIANPHTNSIILPPSNKTASFGQYLSTFLLQPLGLALSIAATGEVRGLSWDLIGSDTTIENHDLASDDYSATVDATRSLAEVLVSDSLLLRSKRNFAYYAGVGKRHELKSIFIAPEYCKQRWADLIVYYELAPRLIKIQVISEEITPLFYAGDTIKLNIDRLPDVLGYVDLHATENAVFPLVGTVISASGSFGEPVQALELLAIPQSPMAKWAPGALVDGDQSPSTTITVHEHEFSGDGRSDTENLYEESDALSIALMLVDANFKRWSDPSVPVYLTGTPTATTITLSTTFKHLGAPASPALLYDNDIIMYAPAAEQPAGFSTYSVGWMADEDGLVDGQTAKRYK